MEKELIDKEVEVLVSFASNFNGSSLTPVVYRGKLLGSDKSFLKLSIYNSELALTSYLGTRFSRNESGIILIQKEYVVYIKQM